MMNCLAKHLPMHAFAVLSTTFFLAILAVTTVQVSIVGDKSSIRNVGVDGKKLVSRGLQANCESFDASKVYHIIARHSGMALRIENNSTDNGSRVVQQQLPNSSSSDTADDWMLQTTSTSGYYSVINVNSNKALDIFHASTALGADVIQYDVVPGSLNQQFCFDNIGNGYFQLIARHSGQALDIFHGLTVAGTKVVQYTKSASSINQQFQVVEVGATISPPPCATFDTTKSYHLVAVHSNKALAIRGASAEPGTPVVQMTTSTTGTEALWSFVPVGSSGHYHVINGNSLLAMNVAGNIPDDGQAIIQWMASASATNDNWCFQDAGGGAYHIVSERSGDAVDVASNSPDDDGITVQWPISGNDNQKFRVIEALGCATFDSTKHYVIMARHSNKVVSVVNTTTDGVVQTTLVDPRIPSHMWALQPIEGGYYHIVNKQSGSGLNIGGNSREPGARLIQWPMEGGEENDDFCFQDLNNGYFTIVARHSGLALDVAREDTSDGATILQYIRTNAYNQQFRVEEVIISTFQPSLSLVPSNLESSLPSASAIPSVSSVSVGPSVAESSPPPSLVPTASPISPPTPGSSITDVPAYNHGPSGALSGELREWHKVTLGFDGPVTSETASPNPFTDYRLDVTFVHSVSGTVMVVPGYYAADGNAANSGAASGYVWLVHVSPGQVGNWTWSAEFTLGANVAQNGGGTSAGFMDGATGSFNIAPTDKTGRDHRGKGRLQYVGEHHLQFAESGEWFLKAGSDAPENFLAYDEFDNTLNIGGLRKSWAPHAQDYREGDPTWAGGKGKNILGAINYLGLEKGMNVFSFLTMNIQGDDQNVFPYITPTIDGRLRIDVSKTAQWEVLFEHADSIGMYLHFKTQEVENDQLLDLGDLGNERRLYYRELIARFSHHLALNWNLGEENINFDFQRKAFSDYFKAVDPYDHIVVVHIFPGDDNRQAAFTPLLGYPTFDGASLQLDPTDVYNVTSEWVQRSAAAGRKWIVANDEQQNASTGVLPDDNDFDHDAIRKGVLWGNIMAGGAGVEYFFGYAYPNSDLTLNDLRSRDNMWTLSKYALDFFANVPFQTMTSRNGLLSNNSNTAWCLANDNVYVIYLRDSGNVNIALPSGSEYSVMWYNPRAGEFLSTSNVTIAAGEGPFPIVAPSGADDWAILIERM